MKQLIAIFSIITLMASCTSSSQLSSSGYNRNDVSFNTFYNELSPYGRWVNYPAYGQVWISNEPGFEPYSTMGHWDYTNYGWMWVSDYAWGWAPFHYGRWDYLNNYGWAWIPGYEWAPAWVGWCNYGGYYGWAPLTPGLGYNYSFNSIPYHYWRFVQPGYINDRNVYRHLQRPDRNGIEINNVTIINNTIVNNNEKYIAGPPANEVERLTKKDLRPKQVAFTESGAKNITVINRNQVRVYRPPVKQSNGQNNNVNVQREIADNEIKNKEPQRQPSTMPVRGNNAQENEGAINTFPSKQQTPAVRETPVRRDNVDEQNPVRQQQVIEKQEAIRQQQEALKREQNEIKAQQQNEIRRQQEIRRKEAIQQQQNELRIQRQNEMRQQRNQQQPEKREQRKQDFQQRQNEFQQQRGYPKREPAEKKPVGKQ